MSFSFTMVSLHKFMFVNLIYRYLHNILTLSMTFISTKCSIRVFISKHDQRLFGAARRICTVKQNMCDLHR